MSFDSINKAKTKLSGIFGSFNEKPKKPTKKETEKSSRLQRKSTKKKNEAQKALYHKIFGPALMGIILLFIIICTALGVTSCDKQGFRNSQFI